MPLVVREQLTRPPAVLQVPCGAEGGSQKIDEDVTEPESDEREDSEPGPSGRLADVEELPPVTMGTTLYGKTRR